MTEHNTAHKVVVIGGGYAGTLAANRLRMRADVDITLVNPRPEFVERIRLHQFVARTGEATIDYGTLLGEGIQLVVDSVTRIDTAARTVRLASGSALDYDYVIYAVGSTAESISSAPVLPRAPISARTPYSSVPTDMSPGSPAPASSQTWTRSGPPSRRGSARPAFTAPRQPRIKSGTGDDLAGP